MKALTTAKLKKREIDDRIIPPTGPGIMTKRPPGLSAVQFIERYGTEEEISGLAALIEARRAKMPRWSYFSCSSCGWKCKLSYFDLSSQERPLYCLRCNRAGYKDGATLKEMSPKEIKAFEKEAAEKERRERERTFRSGLFRRNEERQRAGLPPLSEEEYKNSEARFWASQGAAAKILRGQAKGSR